VSSIGPPSNGSFKLSCCRNRMTSVPSRGSAVSRWQYWIRAWGRGEPATTRSAARAVECAALSCSRVGWTSQVLRPLHPGLSRLRGCRTAASTRPHALGRMAVSRLNMRHSPCVSSRAVNHDGVEQAPGDGRFRRRPLRGADGFVFNTNRRGFESGAMARKNMPASRYSLG
jgi:hypothetical protein